MISMILILGICYLFYGPIFTNCLKEYVFCHSGVVFLSIRANMIVWFKLYPRWFLSWYIKLEEYINIFYCKYEFVYLCISVPFCSIFDYLLNIILGYILYTEYLLCWIIFVLRTYNLLLVLTPRQIQTAYYHNTVII